jgi:rhodanese-related sulfurtransferase
MKKTVIILSSILSIYLMACNSRTTDSTKDSVLTKSDSLNFKSPKTEITVDEALAMSKEEVLIIDVREPDELAEVSYDVSNIKNIPLGELESRLSEVPKDKQIIVVCRSGKRSGNAYDILKENGFTNMANMQGGVLAWQEKGFPITTGGEKKACCENPNNKDCNPDGTCKKPSNK